MSRFEPSKAVVLLNVNTLELSVTAAAGTALAR
jgi:hypothetical protein